ncbi:hypothetical protein AAG570_013187, partial [Ranatra chinensis]
VYKWIRPFEEGGTDTNVEERSVRPSLVSEEVLQQVDVNIANGRRALIDILHEVLPHVSPSLQEELNEFLGENDFSNEEEVKETVEMRFSEVERNVIDEGIKELVPRPKKFIEVDGHYAEK